MIDLIDLSVVRFGRYCKLRRLEYLGDLGYLRDLGDLRDFGDLGDLENKEISEI